MTDDMSEYDIPVGPSELLRGINGDQYPTDGSVGARKHARWLASLPEKLHRIVADNMRKRPHGGIWLADAGLLDMDHPAWSATLRVDTPRGWSAGSTWEDVGGAYDPQHRAVLVGHGRGRSYVTALHEFGHALDDALYFPSEQPAFSEVHARVLPLIQQTSPKAAEYYAQPNDVGKAELFAEGFAWFHTKQSRFLGSAAAGRYLADYYPALEAEVGITP
ncbi:hypothetical protein ABZW96_35650 [Nocardia sp. NPDC004168]|uniref:anthrax toxin lethal factor-related metalloendopeptidase n=1 Tax=Nocardia sp. NPDC004168 TaxID=3154452 RepID=UPI00339FC9DB